MAAFVHSKSFGYEHRRLGSSGNNDDEDCERLDVEFYVFYCIGFIICRANILMLHLSVMLRDIRAFLQFKYSMIIQVFMIP